MTPSSVPGERVAGYDVSDRLDTDYYEVFPDIPDADREVWDRAKASPTRCSRSSTTLGPRRVRPRLRPPDGRTRPFADGIEHEGLGSSSPLAAGLVNMEISRGDGSMGTILAVQGGLALRLVALFGSDEQQAR